MRRYEKLVADDGTPCVVVPQRQVDALTNVANKYSLLMESLGKNVHGFDLMPPEERYGRDGREE